MRRRLLLLSTLVGLALALLIGIDAAYAGNAGAQHATGPCTSLARCPGAATPVPGAAISVSKNGTGLGTVTSVPAGIDCGPTCSRGYIAGTSVTLTATPAAWSTFIGWSGACTGTATCNVSIPHTNGAIAVTATFTVIPHCLVPNLWGKSLAAAERSIVSHDCSVGRITHHASRTVKKRRVTSQKPYPDTELTPGGKVNLVVSKGRR